MDKRIVQKKDGYHMEPWAGDNFSECAETAIREAKALGQPITLHFNDSAIKVTGTSDAKLLWQEKEEQSRKAWEDYTKTPEYKASQARQAAENARDQKKLDQLRGTLDGALQKGIGATVMWLKDYALLADNINMKTYQSEVLKKLKDAGYQNNAHVGRKDLETDYVSFGEYLVGQAINCMQSGMPPHPALTEKFADQILAMETKYKVMHPLKLNGNPPPSDKIDLVHQVKLKPKTGT